MSVKSTIDDFKSLSANERRKVYEALSEIMTEHVKIDSSFENKVNACPCCGEKLSKNGRRPSGIQKYICKSCGKSCDSLSNTLFSGTHKSSDTWKTFIKCTLECKTLRECSAECNVSMTTAFQWRHKLLDAIQELLKDVKLSGIIEADETFLTKSYKGQHSLPRKAKERGTPSNKRGLSKDKLCIPCFIDRNGHVAAGVTNDGVVSIAGLSKMRKHIAEHSDLCTDNAHAYAVFCDDLHLTRHIVKSHGGKKYHVQHVNSIHSRFKNLVNHRFRGVSSRYVNGYIALIAWNTSNNEPNKVEKLIAQLFHVGKGCKWAEINKRQSIPI